LHVLDIPDVVTYTNFGDHRLRVFFGWRGSNFPLSHISTMYTSLTRKGGTRHLCCAYSCPYCPLRRTRQLLSGTGGCAMGQTSCGLDAMSQRAVRVGKCRRLPVSSSSSSGGDRCLCLQWHSSALGCCGSGLRPGSGTGNMAMAEEAPLAQTRGAQGAQAPPIAGQNFFN